MNLYTFTPRSLFLPLSIPSLSPLPYSPSLPSVRQNKMGEAWGRQINAMNRV